LDGLFHDGAVVCEGDTDSQFYAAVSQVGDVERAVEGRHVMFTYAGSKDRIPLITKALRAVGVPVRAIVDFDALNNAGTLRSLVEGLGGQYSGDMESDRRLIDSHIRGNAPRLKVGPVLESIRGILSGDPASEITKPQLESIRTELNPETGWRAAKKTGRAAVPAGDATLALDRLLPQLNAVGVFVVPSGAVESFVKAVGGKGPRWAVEVAAGGHIEKATEAQAFVGEVLNSMLRDSAPHEPAVIADEPPI
jgi:hypothetical protein